MSMTREEIIKTYEGAVFSNALSAVAGNEEAVRDYELLKAGLDALRPVSREQVEKVWRGKWELVRRMAASIECKCPKCQRTVIFTGKPANFCEKCGSANTDEAVEMVMEKMEALKDE